MVPPAAPTLARPPAGPATPPPPPAAATKGTLEASQIAELAARCAKLNQIDYFEVLRISRDATPADIKKAFYSESRTYHPDRFYQLESKELKDQVNELYKRVTEAYYVLRDDMKRRKYLADMASPERAQKLRFTESSEAESKAAVKKEHEEQIGVHPKGRQFYQLGHNDFEAGRWSSAERNLKMALTYEPANARYKERLLEAQRKLNDESKAKGEAFKIK
jgi:DnaJ-class molecular chaperone